MSLPNDEVLQLLADEFVLGNENIEKEDHVGISHGYKPNQTAVGTTNGAGGRNVQIVAMATDGTVLHVLPGYWQADDLVAELEFALRLHRLYRDESRSRDDKLAMYQAMHQAFVRRLSDETRARSRWQDFDVWHEVNRSRTEVRDTFAGAFRADAPMSGPPEMKPICDLVHERMLAQPFVPFDDFDMDAFVDYGRPFYDNNMGLDKGRDFRKAAQANRRRELERAREAELLSRPAHSR